MRLWTIHPSYLDARGLVALWREALLAQKVLRGETRGYTSHPQLVRFRAHPDPLAMISAYLHGVLVEAQGRGFRFNASRITALPCRDKVDESEGQLFFEWRHLQAKLKARDPLLHERYGKIVTPNPHPLFRIMPGEKREWEKGGK
jgi:hypothetical protein